MIPVVTPEEMAAVDAASPEPVEVLVERAGAAVARAALRLLGGAYGRRAVVVAGKGNNGADGRVAARRLRARGVRVQVVEASDAPEVLPASDLVVDAAYGTGFRGAYDAPAPGGAPVLAVDIPSGVDGLTGEAGDGSVRAVATVTFAALKPGLLLAAGWERSGRVEVADIGLDVSGARAHVVEPRDVARWLPPRRRDDHKYSSAVYVVGGSPGMAGAALLCARGAMRAGAGYVRLAMPGVTAAELPVGEHVGRALPAEEWDGEVLDDLARFSALVVGPGLGRGERSLAAARRLIERSPVPVIVDGDGLRSLSPTAPVRTAPARTAPAPVIVTPHDGEYAHLAGDAPAPDRFAAARSLAATTGATVLLKGSTTIVAEPGGRALAGVAGDARLATAGSGDVLGGVIAAFVARGVAPDRAAAGAAVVHGLAGHLGSPSGLVAGDLPELVAAVLSALDRE